MGENNNRNWLKRYLLSLSLAVALFMMVGLQAPPAMAADPEDRVLDLLDSAAENGTLGVYLRDIGSGSPPVASGSQNTGN